MQRRPGTEEGLSHKLQRAQSHLSGVLSGAGDKMLPETMMIALQVPRIFFRFHLKTGEWFTLWFLCSGHVTLATNILFFYHKYGGKECLGCNNDMINRRLIHQNMMIEVTSRL